jgi:hypothetical protein
VNKARVNRDVPLPEKPVSEEGDSFTLGRMVIEPRFLERLLDVTRPDFDDKECSFEFQPCDGSFGIGRGDSIVRYFAFLLSSLRLIDVFI